MVGLYHDCFPIDKGMEFVASESDTEHLLFNLHIQSFCPGECVGGIGNRSASLQGYAPKPVCETSACITVCFLHHKT